MTSGTDVCIRYAISYWAIRAWIDGSSAYALLFAFRHLKPPEERV